MRGGGLQERENSRHTTDHTYDTGAIQTPVTHLQQHLPAVHAHGVHGAEGHEGDGHGRRGVHRIIVTAQQRHEITRLSDIISASEHTTGQD